MLKRIPSIVSVLLCGLLIYNSLGYFFVLSVMKYSVRQQKWAQLKSLPEEKLEKFIFPKNSTQRKYKVVNSREIEVNGNLYDVVRKTEGNSTIVFYCVHDKKEQSLIAKTRVFHSHAHQSPLKNTAKLLFDKIIKTALIQTTKEKFDFKNESCYNFFINPFYSNPIVSGEVKPPNPFKFI